MSGMPWFRMYTEIIDDETIALLAFEDRWHFVALMAMKGKGILDKPFPSEEFRERAIAKKLGLDIDTFKDARARLVDAGLIDRECHPAAWEKRQMRSDSDPSNAARQARYRERKRLEMESTVTRNEDSNDARNATVTRSDTDIDTEEQTCPSVPDELVPVQRKKEKPAPTREQEIAIVNAYLAALPTWPTVTSSRWGKSKARDALLAVWAREPDVRNGDFWPRFFATVRRQKFWNTGNGGQPIDQARFSWLMTPSKFSAVVELMDEQEASL